MRAGTRKKLFRGITAFLAAVIVLFGIFSVMIRIFPALAEKSGAFSLFAAGFLLPNGRTPAPDEKETSTAVSSLSSSLPEKKPDTVSEASSASSPESGSTRSEETPVSVSAVSQVNPNLKIFPVVESQFGASGIKYKNFYVKNSNRYHSINIAEELSRRPDINIKKDGSPQVLIVHTHTCESYMEDDLGFYYEDYYPRTDDPEHNVTRVGAAIAETLKERGIGVIHDTTVHDATYNGSYNRSIETIQKHLQEDPSIQVVLDIHRDALEGSDGAKIKPTFVFAGKKAAQIMIISGCEDDGSFSFPDWEYNLRFALRLQQTAENLYPGITRPLYFSPTRYNMHLTHGSLLIEIGSDANTLEEAVYSGELLGEVLADVLNGLTV